MRTQLAFGLNVFLLTASIACAAQGAASPGPADPYPSTAAETVTPLDANKIGRAADKRNDYAEALRWFQLAANAGLARAQYNVGLYYQRGLGVQRNYPEAAKWLSMAAHQGFAPAQYSFGAMIETVARSSDEIDMAKSWYRKAAAQGDADAAKALSDLQRKTQQSSRALDAMGPRATSSLHRTLTADLIQFDQVSVDEAASFRSLVVRTEVCMYDGAMAMLRNGSRDRDLIGAFQLRTCPGPLIHFMGVTMRNPVPKDRAVAFINDMADAQLNRAVASGK